MNAASLELCKELYGLSDWFDTYLAYYLIDGMPSIRTKIYLGDDIGETHQVVMQAPAYSIGYLLRKLPINQRRRNGYTSTAVVGLQLIRKGTAFTESDYWEASYWKSRDYAFANTPEDALAKLCIELFKQGVLTKEINR